MERVSRRFRACQRSDRVGRVGFWLRISLGGRGIGFRQHRSEREGQSPEVLCDGSQQELVARPGSPS